MGTDPQLSEAKPLLYAVKTDLKKVDPLSNVKWFESLLKVAISSLNLVVKNIRFSLFSKSITTNHYYTRTNVCENCSCKKCKRERSE